MTKPTKAAFSARGRQTRFLSLSAEVGRALTAHHTQADMLRGCAEAIVKNLDAAFARVWVLDEAEDVLVLQASAGMVAFAGHPLVVDDRLIGVVALFARRPLTEATLRAIGSVADEIAVGLERVRIEEALRESEARKGAILTAALDSIIKMDGHGKITEWNPAAERTFGYTRAQAVGQNLRELIIPHGLRDAHQHGLEHFNSTGEGTILNRRIEVPALRADGTEFPAELAVVPVALRGRTLFIAYLRDLTERERAAAQQRAFLRDVLLSVTEGHLLLGQRE